jgi:EamA domain-containing membrane protein RarD
MSPTVIGAFIVGLPAVVVAILLFWRRLRPVFWFALALIVVGVGYLAATGATADIAGAVLGAAR